MSSQMPLVSVIIPNWNGKRFLPTCLQAMKAQTYLGFEVILVDNGSKDGSVALVERDFPWVKVVALRENMGFAAACNVGAEHAEGDVLALLNNDTEAEPGWLDELVKTLQEHPEAGTAASKILLFDRRGVIHSTGDLMGRDGIPRNRGVWEEDRGQYDRNLYVFGGCGAAVAYRREMWEEIGGFDEDLFMYLEDVDLAWRAQLRGWKAVYSPNARVYHHLSATGGGQVASFYTGRNTMLVVVKDMPWNLIRRYWQVVIGAQLHIAFSALRAFRGEAARARLRGQLAALAVLPRWMAKRREVQKTSRMDAEDLDRVLVDFRD